MSSAVGRGLRPGGVVRALGRLVLLIVFGFGAGLLIGVLSEEPELLAGHLRGESEAVVLAPARPPATEATFTVATTVATDEGAAVRERRADDSSHRNLPPVAAASTMRAIEAPADATRNRPSSVSRSASTRSWAIQVGAFSDQAAAQRLARTLDTKGYSAQLLPASGDGGRWRVRVQPIAGEARAREVAGKLKRVERLPTWVLPMEGS